MPSPRYPHLNLPESPEILGFTSHGGGPGDKRFPVRDRQTHGAFLKKRLEQAWIVAENQRVVSHSNRHGMYLEFESDPDFELTLKSLEDLSSKQIRLLNVRKEMRPVQNPETGEKHEQVITYATVYVSHNNKSLT